MRRSAAADGLVCLCVCQLGAVCESEPGTHRRMAFMHSCALVDTTRVVHAMKRGRRRPRPMQTISILLSILIRRLPSIAVPFVAVVIFILLLLLIAPAVR
ncbi:hypothetical protein EXIGLDRAFT_727340 [Exidia glandulosa HHB12029]|uniref:Uncharacterized protein n=1 Tax=Exidia glandulosa HHB12029 TaxID=1314781 RepID=A0A166B7L0_EXIGL|nr:hypothetical protein EXIGLDRAFT_727340 [Exidia glandulosa HHB12029]